MTKLTPDGRATMNTTDAELMKTKEHQFLNPFAPSSMRPLGEKVETVQVDYDIDREDPKKHAKLLKKYKVKVSKSWWDHGSYQATVKGTEKDIRAWMKAAPYDKDYIDDVFESI